jgi:hypothetical protein
VWGETTKRVGSRLHKFRVGACAVLRDHRLEKLRVRRTYKRL